MKRVLRASRVLLPASSDYRDAPSSWRRDLIAGVTVGIVALPLALGFGMSSGAGASAGLVTAIVAGVIAAVFGGSNVQVSGPTGAMVVVLAPIVASHGMAAVALVSIMAGIIVVVAGAARLGRAVSFIPWPVIEGFTLGIAVIIFLQQVPALTSPVRHADAHNNVALVAIDSMLAADPTYLAWALGTVAIVAACMLALPRLHPGIPGSLVGVVAVTLLTLVLADPLAVIGALPATLPAPTVPSADWDTLAALTFPAVTVAALAAIESLLSARVAASMADTGPYDPDRELVGQGLASLGAGLFGGMPATGAIARTAVNVRSGARTRLAAITHAAVLLIVVVALAGPVGAIPLAALSGVLMVTAVRMVHVATARSILRSPRADAAAFVITALVTVSVDLIFAVAIGMAVAAVFALRALSRATGVHREAIRGEAQRGDERIAVVRVDGPLFFAAADRVLAEVTAIEGVSVVVLRMSQLELVDATGAHVLSEIVQQLERRGVTVLIKGVREGHVELFRTVGALGALRHQNHLFTDLPAAVAHARSHIARER
ncbi:SulP family inorganic anion transporter [Microbacterium sp. LRZ72]|uniref:SulP family inorganic anion transporter n=1 Tax=Microbacterium sp. LRZ72 TaxID=2942481 RepID=UPI0029A8DCA9|nr:SulP family inorganic anion transporter [Microbacterium sp. LRZ72]MDX2375521.1 SulP family inorganic anion transporter [Microbacterium sp. LRZ72]